MSDNDDIFQSSDEEANKPTSKKLLKKSTPKIQEDNDDDIFKSSDEESTSNNKKPNDEEFDDLFNSSDDDYQPKNKSKKLGKKKLSKKKEETKKRSSRLSSKKDKKEKKISDKKVSDGNDTSDSYGSEPEDEEDDDDRNFIDEEDDDDNKELVKSYDYKQNFNDDKPIKEKSIKSKSSSSGSSRSSTSSSTGALDPLSQALASLKNPKTAGFTDTEKETVAYGIITKMNEAYKKDELCQAKKIPATNKLNLLPVLKSVLIRKDLTNKLIQNNLLSAIRDWLRPIEIIDDNETVKLILPSLTIRKFLYEYLLITPVELNELQNTGRGKDLLGFVIKTLYSSEDETIENKKILKEIINKWTRLVVNKKEEVESLQEVIKNEKLKRNLLKNIEGKKTNKDNDILKNEDDLNNNDDNSDEPSKKKAKIISDGSDRARAPVSVGYYFTEKPVDQVVIKDTSFDRLDSTRKNIFKKVSDGKKLSATGKKQNIRAISVNISSSK